MSLSRRFVQARAVLGVGASASPGEIKRAYRALVVQHPPDRDGEAFGRVREAYELLREPCRRAGELLNDRRPAIEPPEVDLTEAPRGSTAVVLLRLVASQLDAGELLAELGSSGGEAAVEGVALPAQKASP